MSFWPSLFVRNNRSYWFESSTNCRDADRRSLITKCTLYTKVLGLLEQICVCLMFDVWCHSDKVHRLVKLFALLIFWWKSFHRSGWNDFSRRHSAMTIRAVRKEYVQKMLFFNLDGFSITLVPLATGTANGFGDLNTNTQRTAIPFAYYRSSADLHLLKPVFSSQIACLISFVNLI